MVALGIVGLIIGALVFDIVVTTTGRMIGVRRRNNRMRLSGAGDLPLLTESLDFRIAPGFFHTRGHVWLNWRPDGKIVVGVNDLLPRVAGRIDELLPPAYGSNLRRGEKAVLLRQGDRVLYLPSPAEGFVVESNPAVHDNPHLVKEDPYGEGWLYVMLPTTAEADMPYWMVSRRAEDWLRRETERMRHFFLETLNTGAEVASGASNAGMVGLLERMNDTVWMFFKNQFIYQQEWRS